LRTTTGTVHSHTSVNGRRVDFNRYNSGAPNRAVFEYGTPGTRWLSPRLVRAAETAGFELLVIDRPGYGTATRQRNRSVADVVVDVTAVVDELGWDRFAVWGGSGGAPHALAVATLLPERVSACASVSGPAPYDAPGLDWYSGMSQGNVDELHAAAQGEEIYRPMVERLARDAVDEVEAGGVPIAADYSLPDSDQRILEASRADATYQQRMRMTYLAGIDGWIDDCIATTRPWGFDPADVDVPVSVWYGVDDALVPSAHADYLLATISEAERRELAGGHLLNEQDLADIYAWLSRASR
jgi:pimeloyl-ACP methyl ester carboxylesterase